MQYVKRLRLEKARRLLIAADTKQSVTAVAFACGFLNLGHFARDYRNQYGELPSQTLLRRTIRGYSGKPPGAERAQARGDRKVTRHLRRVQVQGETPVNQE
jgi:AraC-like DNA-binding protein